MSRGEVRYHRAAPVYNMGERIGEQSGFQIRAERLEGSTPYSPAKCMACRRQRVRQNGFIHGWLSGRKRWIANPLEKSHAGSNPAPCSKHKWRSLPESVMRFLEGLALASQGGCKPPVSGCGSSTLSPSTILRTGSSVGRARD